MSTFSKTNKSGPRISVHGPSLRSLVISEMGKKGLTPYLLGRKSNVSTTQIIRILNPNPSRRRFTETVLNSLAEALEFEGGKSAFLTQCGQESSVGEVSIPKHPVFSNSQCLDVLERVQNVHDIIRGYDEELGRWCKTSQIQKQTTFIIGIVSGCLYSKNTNFSSAIDHIDKNGQFRKDHRWLRYLIAAAYLISIEKSWLAPDLLRETIVHLPAVHQETLKTKLDDVVVQCERAE